ncbi:hypothetical protein ACQPZX_17370 [Actinoplanes sp. CA-142083]|uniref:hypothetical protein n=1 Tax=Actinoplanes sp. CA-142083 TaxID=3239903 RepID=UPI003D90AF06
MIGRIFDAVYVGLMTNLLLTAACLPLVVLLVTTDPGRSWPLLALLSPLIGPALCGAFAVLSTLDRPVQTFIRVWRSSAPRALAVAGLCAALVVVLAVDCRWALGHAAGALAIPLLVVVMVLAVATTLLALVVLSERPTTRVRDACRVSVYLAVRHWYLTVPSLAVLAIFEALLAARPAVALGLAAAPLLYVVWAGSRFSLNPVLTKGTS